MRLKPVSNFFCCEIQNNSGLKGFLFFALKNRLILHDAVKCLAQVYMGVWCVKQSAWRDTFLYSDPHDINVKN